VKFSIVTPSFNQGRFIRDCIESVRTQEGVETEHIVIDACSTDETLSIVKGYPHLQWVSEPDKGQTDAINKGFRKATGDWLMWLNADDYLLPGALARVQTFAAEHHHADIIYGDCYFVKEDGRVTSRKREFDFDFNMLLFYGCFIPSTSAFYKRAVVDAGFLLDASYKVCMDYEYYMRLAHAGFTFAHIAEPLACFRWHETNISSVLADRRYEEARKIQHHYLRVLNRAHLDREWILNLVCTGYKAQRWLRRLPYRLAAT
jgi:glycosyltransferase involved in cell wall biosynthesis